MLERGRPPFIERERIGQVMHCELRVFVLYRRVVLATVRKATPNQMGYIRRAIITVGDTNDYQAHPSL